MEHLTLEKELYARIFLHKVAITGGTLMKQYIAKESQGDIKLPTSTLEEQADKYSNNRMQQAMQDGTFETLYQEAWESIKHTIPEYMKVV